MPERTALFTIGRLLERGLLTRHLGPTDGRRVNIQLSASWVHMLNDCFDDVLVLVRQQQLTAHQ